MVEPDQSKNLRAPLHRDAIVDAAIELANAFGVESLTMRKLADRLGFKVMALYNHVANKNELLSLMADRVATEISIPDQEGDDPLGIVRSSAIEMKDALTKHPWAANLWLTSLPGPARTAQTEHLLRCFARCDLAPDLAHHGYHAVTNHVIGFAIQEIGMAASFATDPDEPWAVAYEYLAQLSEAEHPHVIAHVHQHLDGETTSSFELVLDFIIEGLISRSQGSN